MDEMKLQKIKVPYGMQVLFDVVRHGVVRMSPKRQN